MSDLYAILGVKETASPAEIKKAYRKLSKKFHPDVNDGDKYFEERFKEIQNAYEILSDSIGRSKYDASRRGFGGQSSNHDFFSREEQLKKEREEIRKKEEELRHKEEELKRKEDRFKKDEPKDDKRKPFASWIAVTTVFVIGLLLVGNIFRSRSVEKSKWNSAPIVEDSAKDPLHILTNKEAVKKPWERYKSINNEIKWIDDKGFGSLKEGHWQGTAHQYNINEAWEIRLAYDETNKVFIVKYPTLNCTGRWIVTKVTNSQVEFIEFIDEGQNSCTNGGKVVLKRLTEKDNPKKWTPPEDAIEIITSLEYLYYWPDEETLDARGQINRKE